LLTGLRDIRLEHAVRVFGALRERSGSGNFGHTLFIYEENVHVP
jgi:hypothetical protein